ELWGVSAVAKALEVDPLQVARWTRGDSDADLGQLRGISFSKSRALQKAVREPWCRHQHQLYCNTLFALAQRRHPANSARCTVVDDGIVFERGHAGESEFPGDCLLPRAHARQFTDSASVKKSFVNTYRKIA